jgi:hypothetical protein
MNGKIKMKKIIFGWLLIISSLALNAEQGITWEPLCEPGGGGAIVALAVSPHNAKHIITSGDMLGAAVSFDGGDSWKPAFGFSSYEMADITFHPTDSDVVWMGTCMGPYKSVDGGRNWVSKRNGMGRKIGSGYSVMIEKILFVPNDPLHLLAFGGSSRHWNQSETFGWIWESLDDGETWKHIATLDKNGFSQAEKKGVNIWSAQYVPGSVAELNVLADDIGWWTSDDNGKTWQKKEYQGVSGGISGLTFNPVNPDVVWVTTHNYSNDGKSKLLPGGVFKSIDGGKTFKPSDIGIAKVATGDGNQTSWFKKIAVSAQNPKVLYVNDQAWNSAIIYKSIDGGGSWKPVASRGGIGTEQSEESKKVFQVETACFAGIAMNLVADPNNSDKIYGFNTEFILRSIDGGKIWDDATAYRPDPSKKDNWRGRGWNGWCSINAAFNPYKKGQSIVQAMDAGRGWISDDGLQSWRYVSGEPNPWLGGKDVSFSKDGYIYITTGHFGHGNGIVRSTDWGKSWKVLYGEKHGLPDAGWNGGKEYAGVFVLPENGKIAWVVLDGQLLKTKDGGENWSEVPEVGAANYIAGDPAHPGRFYIKTKSGILVSDAGKSFTNIGLPNISYRSRINCDSKGRVLVCQWRQERGGVWRYTPETKKWKRLLDEHLAYECNADPNDPTRLLVVTSMDPFYDNARGNGVWISCDDGKSWSQANDGIGMMRANACAFNPFNSEEIIVGTYGMGFFKSIWSKQFKPKGTRQYISNDQDTAATELEKVNVKNGSMTAGTEKPDDWGSSWGDVTSVRDVKVFKSSPASLRVDVKDGKNGQVFQQINGAGGSTLKVSGWVKTQGDVKVNVAIQSFDEGWSKNHFDQLKYIQGTSSWGYFEKLVEIPGWSARFNVLILVEGNGSAWLDDVKLERK